MRRLLPLALALAACAPASAAPAARADGPLYLEWSTYQSPELGGDRLYVRGWRDGTFPEAIRLLDAEGGAVAEAPARAWSPESSPAGWCLRREPGAPIAALPFPASAAMALNAGRVEARVSGLWTRVVLASRGCHSTAEGRAGAGRA